MKGVKNERRQADKVEVQRVRRPRSLEQNKDADQKVQKADDFEVLLMAKVLWRRRSDDNRRIDFLFVSDDRVGGLRTRLPIRTESA